jgi:hypothetical protein
MSDRHRSAMPSRRKELELSVATQLGLSDPDDPDDPVLQEARSLWTTWQARHPALVPVPDLMDLPGWLSSAARDRADAVLLVLAELAAPDGGDSMAATGALAWVLLPGASLVAHRLRPLSPRIDELVAAQLWVEARTFPWRRGRRVAANILRNTRKGVLRDLAVGPHVDQAWRDRVPLTPGTAVWRQVETPSSDRTPAQELADVLARACERGAINGGDRVLLLQLAEAADRAATRRLHRGQFGLMTPAASGAVAARWGISAGTVRRRARRAVGAVAATCPETRPSTRIAG